MKTENRNKRVVFTMGGKGGVGKTGLMVALAEWVRMEFRLAELENPARQHGVRLGQVATRQNSVDELKRASIVMRAESYRRRLFSEFDRAKEMFLP